MTAVFAIATARAVVRVAVTVDGRGRRDAVGGVSHV